MAEAAPHQAPAELTARALLTGVVLGAILTPCNIYSGLKIGWSFNMSIAALLIGYLIWVPTSRVLGLRHWGLLESNISQTAASSAASIISGGLVAPIPALALLTGSNLPFSALAIWVFSVSFLGIWVGWYLRDGLIVRSSLAFPAGVASAETMRDIFSHGREGVLRVRALLSSLGSALAFNLIDKVIWAIPRWAPATTVKQLTFFLDPSLLMLGFGSIIGLRAGVSLLLGGIAAWGLIAPRLVSTGVVAVDAAAAGWFQPLVEWLLWPGVTLMLAASLTSVVLAMARYRRQGWGGFSGGGGDSRMRVAGLACASVLVVLLQVYLFGIHWLVAALAVPMAFVLAAVAGRVVGETGIAPIGAIGKVAQLSFGVATPAEPAVNLMTANVAGGTAGQAADLLNDLKAGHLVGATARLQVIAQCFGVATGSLVGSYIYLRLIPFPLEQLLTPEWPAPAVAVWKAVADLLKAGIDQIPPGAGLAAVIGAFLGAGLALATERFGPKVRAWLPSGNALGLAFVIPASTSMTLFAGSAIAAVLLRFAPNWSRRFLLSIAAGLIAGESLFGIAAVFL